MTELLLLPDVERLLVAFLLDQPEVLAFFTADAPHDRVYTELPATKVWPAVRVARFGGSPRIQRPLYIDQANIQIDSWGGPKRTAERLGQTCRAAMAERLLGVHDDGIVTAVDFGSWSDQPDTTFDPARPRFRFDATVTVHPNPVLES